MKFVLENGADPNIRTKDQRITGGQSCLHYLARYIDDRDFLKNKAFFDLLVKFKADLDIFDSSETTPLMHAARNKNIKAVKYLLQKGADITKINVSGNTFMHEACSAFEDKEFYKKLKDQDESIFYAEKSDGRRPIDGVLSARVPNQFKHFIELGIDFSKVNSQGENILQMLDLDVDKIKRVIENVERIDKENSPKGKGTILRQAMLKGDEKLVKYLLSVSAKVPEDYDPAKIKDEVLGGRRALRRIAILNRNKVLNAGEDQLPELMVTKEIHALIKAHQEKQQK